MSLYRKFEKAFWFTLTRKIIGNVIALLLPQLILIVAALVLLQRLKGEISALGIEHALVPVVSNFGWLLTISSLLALSSGIFTVFFMRKLFFTPINEITEVLNAINEKDGDISATLPDYTHDEISEMAKSYNQFSQQLKEMIDQARDHSVHVALNSAQVLKAVNQSSQASEKQEIQAEEILEASSQSAHAIDEIANNTLQISNQTKANLHEIQSSSQELGQVSLQIQSVAQLAQGFQDTVGTLSQNSANIINILRLVEDFSEQTNLLALNASIEAARAGDAGRGFAVVADEVRGLAQKVSEATQQINNNIGEMTHLVSQTEQGSANILTSIQEADAFLGRTNDQFLGLVASFEQMSGQLTTISSSLEELSHTTHSTHAHVKDITDLSRSIRENMDITRDSSYELEAASQRTQELLSRFIIGYGGFESITQTGLNWAQQLTDKLEGLLAQGVNVFDSQHKAINPGDPIVLYTTSYIQAALPVLQPLYDSFLQEKPDFAYAVGSTRSGLVPVHHKKLSNPLTGNFEVDNLKTRHQRIYFDSRAEKLRCTHESPFLLQTFIRDTGEILNDLSIPIYVKGQRWGSLIMGFETKHLLK